MQKSAGIWMNHQRAYIIENCNGKETLAIVHALAQPLSSTARKNYFQNLSEELAGAQDIFVCGPGSLKDSFAEFLSQKHSHLHVELDPVLSHPTLNQLRAKTRQHSLGNIMAC